MSRRCRWNSSVSSPRSWPRGGAGAAEHFDEDGLTSLLFAIAAINFCNRVAICAGTTPASYGAPSTGRRHDPGSAMDPSRIVLDPIGVVESPLTDPAVAPKQGREGAPDAWLVFDERVLDGLREILPGDELIVLTWLDRADRDVLRVHPRDDVSNPRRGVFSTRSADRPNPIGLHEVEVAAVDGPRMRVRHLEALDGTPVIDVKPVLHGP
jgi:tRNA-Thr(GGU) m(6)t(6)A37 methyltransferase TsaA